MFKLLYTHFNAYLTPTKHRYVNKLAFPWKVIIKRLLGHPVYNTEQYVMKVKRIKLALHCCNKDIHLKMSQILPCPSNINKLAFHMFLTLQTTWFSAGTFSAQPFCAGRQISKNFSFASSNDGFISFRDSPYAKLPHRIYPCCGSMLQYSHS